MVHRVDGLCGLTFRRPRITNYCNGQDFLVELTGTETKSSLRNHCRSQRSRRHSVRNTLESERLADNFLAKIKLSTADCIAGYWPINSEIDVIPLLIRLHKLGFKLCLPIVQARTKILDFRSWCPADALEKRAFGIHVPKAVKPKVIPQLLIVPLVAFDEKGNRLGYGGGYYDSTLFGMAKSRPIAIGAAFEDQCVEDVPTDPHDVPLDWVITEKCSRRIRGI